jgi:hypothetical protein
VAQLPNPGTPYENVLGKPFVHAKDNPHVTLNILRDERVGESCREGVIESLQSPGLSIPDLCRVKWIWVGVEHEDALAAGIVQEPA